MLVTISDFALPQPQEAQQSVDFETVSFIGRQFLERPQSQRAPPVPFSFA